jgi:hypothetical protein
VTGRRRAGRLIIAAAILCLGPAAPAAADWHLTPFIGVVFGGDTNLVDLDQAAGERKVTYGGSGMYLGAGLLGVEIDFSQPSWDTSSSPFRCT